MSGCGPFIKKLWDGWKQWIDDKRADPTRIARFRLTLVAGLKDKFVPTDSSLDPFPFDGHEYCPGNHTEIVKPDQAGQVPMQILKKRLLRGGLTTEQRRLIHGESNEAVLEMNRVSAAVDLGDVEALKDMANKLLVQSPSQMPRVERALGLALSAYEQFDDAAKRLTRYLEFQMPDDGSRPFSMDAQAVQQLAVTLSGMGDNLTALSRLNSLPPEVHDLSETLGIRGGRLKRQWLLRPNRRGVGLQALNTYRTGYESAKSAKDIDQQLYNGINVAYMTFALGDSGYEAIAHEVLQCCARQDKPGYWTAATRAEGLLLLRRYADALQAYQHAVSQSPFPRYVGTTWIQASEILRRQGNPPEAQLLIEELAKFQPAPVVELSSA